MYAAALESGFEGIVAKRKDSPYQPGRRSAAWQKIKAVRSSEFVVGGYTQGQGARHALGALLLGYWDGDELKFAGHVGSGLDEAGVGSLGKRFAALETRKRPFAEQPPLHRPTTWLEPELVAEVKFSGWTPDGHLRAPVFLRMRDDIAASDIRGGPDGSESGGEPPRKDPGSADEIGDVLRQLDQKGNRIDLQVGSARIRLTNLDREYWPGGARGRPPPITKRELLRYLARASPYLLTHLRNRPLTMIRMPEGIGGERFFQKHWRQERPEFVESVEVYSGSKDEEQEYLLANNLPTLLWLGQVGTLEFHVWHSRAEGGPDWKGKSTDYSSSLEALERSVLNYPDYLVFDMPPGTGDAQLSLSQIIPLSGVVMVTTPQDVALLDVRKGLAMFRKLNVPILGVVENMSYFQAPDTGTRYAIFGEGGGARVAEEFGVPLLGQIPLEMETRRGGDAGVPIVVGQPDSTQAAAFRAIAVAVTDRVRALASLQLPKLG